MNEIVLVDPDKVTLADAEGVAVPNKFDVETDAALLIIRCEMNIFVLMLAQKNEDKSMDIQDSIAQAAATIAQNQKQPPRPGYYSTEFGTVGTVVTYLLSQDFLSKDHWYGITAAGLALGYSVLRTYLKG